MAQGAAIAIAMGIVISRPRRQPNIFATSIRFKWSYYVAIRLIQHEVYHLALEYVSWQLQVHGVKMGYHTCVKVVQVLLHYIARGSYYHQLGRAEGIAKSTVIDSKN